MCDLIKLKMFPISLRFHVQLTPAHRISELLLLLPPTTLYYFSAKLSSWKIQIIWLLCAARYIKLISRKRERGTSREIECGRCVCNQFSLVFMSRQAAPHLHFGSIDLEHFEIILNIQARMLREYIPCNRTTKISRMSEKKCNFENRIHD